MFVRFGDEGILYIIAVERQVITTSTRWYNANCQYFPHVYQKLSTATSKSESYSEDKIKVVGK